MVGDDNRRARFQGRGPWATGLQSLSFAFESSPSRSPEHDPAGGVTNVNLREAEVKRAMLLSARRPVVLADGSKLGEVEVAKICDLSEVSLVVADASADPSILADLAAAGCEGEAR
jgi:DeoR/GlpR family transcriptional regulator of sugar metabolism